jgi:hypothetical protein
MRRRPDPSDEQSFDDTPAAVGVDGLAVDPKALRRLAELEGRGAMSDIHQVAPTPWRTWLGYRESDRGHRYYILDAQGDVIAGIMDSEDPEMTGQRLVRAANSHDALVAALRAVEWVWFDNDNKWRRLCPHCKRWDGDGHAPDCQLDAALRDAEPD